MSQPIPSLTRPSKLAQACAEFVLTHGRNLYSPIQRDQIERFIDLHIDYCTIIIVRDRDEIVAVGRWNTIDNETICVLDLIIHPKFRRKNVMKRMLVEFSMNYPWVKKISFHRKKHNRDATYLIKQFLGGKHGWRN